MGIVQLDRIQASEGRVSERLARQLTHDVRILDRGKNIGSQTQAAVRRRQLAQFLPNTSRAEALLERILQGNDLAPVAFLQLGVRASRAVGRLQRTDASQGRFYGTGFLVGPAVLMTNNHVLPDASSARETLLDLDYELDCQGLELPPQRHRLAPDRLFLTNKELDCTLVAVDARPELGSQSLAQFGWLPLSAEPGKAIVGEFLSIIQHPAGERKQVCVRENKLLKYGDESLWYQADTVPGSSGSPVFNPFWQVVALHHSGVPERDSRGRVLLSDGTAVPDVQLKNQDESRIRWIANEGIRISVIMRWLRGVASGNRLLAAVLAGQQPALSSPPRPDRPHSPTGPPDTTGLSAPDEVDSPAPNAAQPLTDGSGYNPFHLGSGACELPLPDDVELLPADVTRAAEQAPGTASPQPWELPCDGFSVVYSAAQRRTALVAGHLAASPNPTAEAGPRRREGRLPQAWQPAPGSGPDPGDPEAGLLLLVGEALPELRRGSESDLWLTTNHVGTSPTPPSDWSHWLKLTRSIATRLRETHAPVTIWAGVWPADRGESRRESRGALPNDSAGLWKLHAWRAVDRVCVVCLAWSWSSRDSGSVGAVRQIPFTTLRDSLGWSVTGGWCEVIDAPALPAEGRPVHQIAELTWPSDRPDPI